MLHWCQTGNRTLNAKSDQLWREECSPEGCIKISKTQMRSYGNSEHKEEYSAEGVKDNGSESWDESLCSAAFRWWFCGHSAEQSLQSDESNHTGSVCCSSAQTRGLKPKGRFVLLFKTMQISVCSAL